MIPYGKQHITPEDLNAVTTVLQSDFLTQGPAVKKFEDEFAEYIGCKYAVAVSNGTAALHLAALALEVDEKSKVLTSPITFAASANCILYCGGSVDFVDVDEHAVMSIEGLKKKLQESPKGTYQGIVPVDFAGYPVNLEEISKLAKEYNLWILEDACHAPGGGFIDSKGKFNKCGDCNYADAAIFSFHPVKHIACGEGGMITTNRKDIYDKLILLRTHGITKDPNLMHKNDGPWYYEMQELGYNYRLTDFQAALGSSQLKRADQGLQRRIDIAHKYNISFDQNDIEYIPFVKNGVHAYHLFIVYSKDRKGLYEHLRKNNIFAQVHYIPVHTLPYYKGLGFKEGAFPNAEKHYAECLSLPMYPTLTNEEQDFVIQKVIEFSKP